MPFWDTAVVHDPTAFTDPENWTGGFYELSSEIGDYDDERLQRGLNTLWRTAAVTGCYGNTAREPAVQIAVPVTVASLRSSATCTASYASTWARPRRVRLFLHPHRRRPH